MCSPGGQAVGIIGVMADSSIACSACDWTITGSPDEPCPRCGSLARTINLHVSDQIHVGTEVTGSLSVTQDDQVAAFSGTVVNPETIALGVALPQATPNVERTAASIIDDLRIALWNPTIEDMTFRLLVNGEEVAQDADWEAIALEFGIWFRDHYYDGPSA